MSRLNIKLTSVLVLTIFVLNTKINAQSEIRVPQKSLKVKWEGFWEAFENIEKGDKWARKGKGAIPMALEYYLKALDYNNTCPELNCKIGICYLKSDRKSKALSYLKTAYDKNSEIIPDQTLLLAKAYHYNMEFDKAIEFYTIYYKSLKDREKEKRVVEINHYTDQCKNGKALVEKPKRAAITLLDQTINSAYDDYNPVMVGTDSIMYFTSRRPSGKRPKHDRVNYLFDEDIYVSTMKNDNWTKAQYLDDADYNTKRSDAMIWTSGDGKERYIYDGFMRGGSILVSYYKKGKWTHPKKVSRLNSRFKESSITITADGKNLFFVSEEPSENFGGKDIFFTKKDNKGRWELPRNMGATINTKFDEEGVYVRPDGKVLYFSSQGHNSMGGFDIFKTELDANGRWSKPENLGYPLNTPEDELFYRTMNSDRVAYFSSVREEGKGGWDIFKVIFLGEEKKMLLKTEEQLIAYFEKPLVDLFSKKTAELKIDSAYIMKGIIMDAATKKPIIGRLNLIDLEVSQAIGTAISDSTGAYKVSFPKPKNYGIEINAKDYMFFLDVIDLSKVTTREIIRNFALNKIKAGAKVVLKNIYFQTGKAILTVESYAELNKVVNFLKENTELKIEISGHTDNVGGAAYNVRLSGSRAQAVVDYLVAQGIPREQLIAKGYGMAQPIAPNTNAKGRQMNRRVEFKILSTE